MASQRRKRIVAAGILLGGVGGATAQEVVPPATSPYHVVQWTGWASAARDSHLPAAATQAPVTPPVSPPVTPPAAADSAAATPPPTKEAAGTAPTPPAANCVSGSTPLASPLTQGKYKPRRDGVGPVPFGQCVAMSMEAQIANGVAARMTLYDYDFERGTDKLNYRGRDRLRQIAALTSCNVYPVMVERLPYRPELADARRMTVLNELLAMASVPAERVVVGAPLAVPMRGNQGEIIYQNMISSTQTYGIAVFQGIESGGLPQVTPLLGGVTGGGGIAGTNAIGGGAIGPGNLPR